jgi:hypothetical protein
MIFIFSVGIIYLNYSSYRKEQDGFKDSTRFIPGIAFNYQKLTVQAELEVISKNYKCFFIPFIIASTSRKALTVS